MSAITTHVLDTARGCPAAGVPITLERLDGPAAAVIGVGVTDVDGRLRTLLGSQPLERGVYRITFDTSAYDAASFYPEVTVTFEVRDATQHHHVPLLLSPFGYSTYRGS